MKRLALLAPLALLSLSAACHATAVAYDISGTQSNGNFSGSFLYDPSTGVISGGTINAYANMFDKATSSFQFSSASGNSAAFNLMPFTLASGGTFAATFDLDLAGTMGNPVIGMGTGSTFFFLPVPGVKAYDGTDPVISGTITADAPASATTPEPSSFVLLGTGVIAAAGAARRRLFGA